MTFSQTAKVGNQAVAWLGDDMDVSVSYVFVTYPLIFVTSRAKGW